MKRLIGALALMVSCAAAGIPILGCGTSGGAVAPTVVVCRTGAKTVCLTRVDGGRTVKVRLGEAIGLTLNNGGLVWSNPEPVGARLLRQTSAVARGGTQLTVWYQAIKVGTTSLRATATPRCTAGQACPQFVLLWQVRLAIDR
jgi:hypothetical protein